MKLDKFVTNARNPSLSMWRQSLNMPYRRCIVPLTQFEEPHPEGGKGDDNLPKQMWFSLPDQPIAFFAGLWRQTERGAAFAFGTTEPVDTVLRGIPSQCRLFSTLRSADPAGRQRGRGPGAGSTL